MSEFVTRIQELVSSGDVSVSVHGFRELAADGILLDDVTGGVSAAIVVEEYLVGSFSQSEGFMPGSIDRCLSVLPGADPYNFAESGD